MTHSDSAPGGRRYPDGPATVACQRKGELVAARLVGLSEAEAVREIVRAGFDPEVFRGNPGLVAAIFKPNRIGMVVDDAGIVTSAGCG